MSESFDMSKVNDLSDQLIKELEKYADNIRGELEYEAYMESASALSEAMDYYGEDEDTGALDVESFLDEPSSYAQELINELARVRDHIKYLKQFNIAT